MLGMDEVHAPSWQICGSTRTGHYLHKAPIYKYSEGVNPSVKFWLHFSVEGGDWYLPFGPSPGGHKNPIDAGGSGAHL